MNDSQVIRWGILGAARIAVERLFPAIRMAKNGELFAIASRNEEKARHLAETHGIRRKCMGYPSLLPISSSICLRQP